MQKEEKGYFENDSDFDGDSIEDGVSRETIDEPFEDIDDEIVADIDFSQIQGKNFKTSLSKLNRAYRFRQRNKRAKLRKRKKMPLSQEIGVDGNATIYGSKQGRAKTIQRVIVPNDRELMVEGVDRLILGKDSRCDSIRNIGYYKCKKLRELVLTMNNNSVIDFNLELFNPSNPLDYLFATSGNLNNKVQVAGGVVSYSDILFNILANPTHIVNAKFTFSGVNVSGQLSQPLLFKQKNTAGEQVIHPLQLQLQVDVYQYQPDIVFFDFQSQLDRPFVPNGMDVIQYKVLAGNSVTFSFFYRQKDLRKFFFKEARKSKKLMS